MKENIVKKIIIVLLVFSYILLLLHFLSPSKTKCTLEEKEDIYTKKQTIVIKAKKGTIQEIIHIETVSSQIPNILDIKEKEYEKKEYKIRKNKNKIKATKKEKTKKTYKEMIQTLTEGGYSCYR